MAVLAYGYWFAATHASLWISVEDVSDARRPQSIYEVDVTFRDASGRALARASGAKPYFAITLAWPEAFSCRDIEQRATLDDASRRQWNECFARQSRWIPTWIENAAAVDVRTGECDVRNIPVEMFRHGGEWWTWWVPLPHIGGKPYTLFSTSVRIDPQRCAAG